MKTELQIISICIIALLAACKSSRNTASRLPEKPVLLSFEVVRDLNLDITETSGLVSYNNYLLTHNDSGDGPDIFVMDTLGVIKTKKTFTHLTNVDWEDIDASKTELFIADTGNNYGNRNDLKIYKMPWSTFEQQAGAVDSMTVIYKNQESFEILPQQHPYDAEAITYYNDQLLLFSKNWVDFTTEIYQVAWQNQNGPQEYTQSLKVNGLITGATNNGKDRVVLCGYNSALQPFIIVLRQDDQKRFYISHRIRLPLEDGAQVEAITHFKNSNGQEIYYLTSEAVNIKLGDVEAHSPGQLYKMSLDAAEK